MLKKIFEIEKFGAGVNILIQKQLYKKYSAGKNFLSRKSNKKNFGAGESLSQKISGKNLVMKKIFEAGK